MKRRDIALIVSLCALCAAGCHSDEVGKGGLVAVIESDLSVPKDLDRISLRVKQAGRTPALEERDLASDDAALPQVFPLQLTSGGEVTLIAVGYKDGSPRAQRTAIVTVPTAYVGMVRLPLDFLCEHMVTDEGSSSCGPDNTCIQGLCGPARLSDVPRYDEPLDAGAEVARAAVGDGECFDAPACFADAQAVALDPSTCSFAVESDPDTSSSLNVALELPPLGAGACGRDNCWVVLTPGDSDGWVLEGANRIVLSSGICHAGDGSFRVVLSRSCPTRARSTALCGPDTASYAATGRDLGSPPPAGGDACAGLSAESCGSCGLRERTCKSGHWSDWGECLGERACSAGSERECESGGTQICRDDCTWGECLGKQCPAGPRAQACGHCGIQSRNCDNGVWSEWSACAENGECKPDDTKSCGANGTQICNGICHWGACENQVCPGASSMSCGNCGQKTRTCNADTGVWSDWSECHDEAECKPNATRSCENGGTETCGGDCRWENVCRGQTCDGRPTQSCPMCGTQTRSCDSDTGQWSEFGECQDQGVCAPNTTRACQNNGSERCGSDCRWSGRCEGQRCVGASSQKCGYCGTQTRSCNSDTGLWNAWGACEEPLGACTPGATSECGTRGTRLCNESCVWGQVCMNQQCSGTPPTKDCGCHPSTSGACNPLTGQYSSPPDCSTEACTCSGSAPTRQCVGCHPDTKATCNTATGQWSEPPECMTGPCACVGTAPVDDCGCHGKLPRTCDSVTGTWVAQTCPTGACTCAAADKPANISCCGTTLEAQCDPSSGKWSQPLCATPPGMCVCDRAAMPKSITCCGVVRTPICNRDSGAWMPPTACEIPAGKCPCDDANKPKDSVCCSTTLPPQCDHSDGHWTTPDCQSPCDCSQDPKPPSPKECPCQQPPIDAMCNPDTGKWSTPTCPDVTCTPQCPGEEPTSKCGPCDLGTQRYTCDPGQLTWMPSRCELPDGVCDPAAASDATRACVVSDRKGTQTCSRETCTWGACQLACPSSMPDKTVCGPCDRGTPVYTCAPKTGTWVEDCKLPQEVCDPAQGPRDCSGGDVQYCESKTCSWVACPR